MAAVTSAAGSEFAYVLHRQGTSAFWSSVQHCEVGGVPPVTAEAQPDSEVGLHEVPRTWGTDSAIHSKSTARHQTPTTPLQLIAMLLFLPRGASMDLTPCRSQEFWIRKYCALTQVPDWSGPNSCTLQIVVVVAIICSWSRQLEIYSCYSSWNNLEEQQIPKSIS